MMKSGRLLPFCFVLCFTLSLVSSPVSAQENQAKSKLDLSADILSRYVWRGMNLGGPSPSIQPNLEYTYGNFAAGAWAAYSFSNAITRQECDLYLSYSFKQLLNLTLTDYYFPFEDTNVNDYFNYQKDKTGHIFELSAKFSGTKKIPFSLMVASNLYGADARKSNGDIQYSTYIELGYNFSIRETSCNAFLGLTPNKPDKVKGETGFYGNDPGVINLGITASKTVKVTDSFSLPLNASLITNPTAGNIYLVFGFSL